MNSWQRSRRVYAEPQDRRFWEALLQAGAPQPAKDSFYMSLVIFLHTEFDSIAALWTTAESRHALWRQLYLSGCKLPILIYRVGCELAKHQQQQQHRAFTFRTKASQNIYEAQVKLAASEADEEVDSVEATSHAEALQQFDENAADEQEEVKHDDERRRRLSPQPQQDAMEIDAGSGVPTADRRSSLRQQGAPDPSIAQALKGQHQRL